MSESEKKKHRAKQFRECQKKRRALQRVNSGTCPRCYAILRETGWDRKDITKGRHRIDQNHCYTFACPQCNRLRCTMTAISAADWHCDQGKEYRAQVQAIQ